MNKDFQDYNDKQADDRKPICDLLMSEISAEMGESESKIWHGAPVWFIEGNPIVGYDNLKDSVRILFWSGQSFDEKGLKNEGSFKAAEVRYTNVDQVNVEDLKRWLKKAKSIQWNYKDIVKNKGLVERIK